MTTHPKAEVAMREEAQAPAKSHAPQTVLDVFSSESFKQQVALALPKHISVESMMRVVLTEVRLHPDLQKCTVPSFMGALLKAAQSGLRPGMFGEGWIIARWNGKLKCYEAQFQPGYMGLAQLAYRSKEVSEVHMVAVYSADHFAFQLGSDPKIEHTPDLTAEHRPEDIVAFYAVVKLVNGGRLMKVMPRRDVDDVRDRFGPRNKEGKLVGPWATDYEAMGCKTVLIQCLKLAPKESERLQVALAAESEALFADRVASAVAQGNAADRVAARLGVEPETGEIIEADATEDDAIAAQEADYGVPTPSEGADSSELFGGGE